MNDEKRSDSYLLKEIENLRDFFETRARKERENANNHRCDSFLYGLESGYASGFELASEYLDDIIKNKP